MSFVSANRIRVLLLFAFPAAFTGLLPAGETASLERPRLIPGGAIGLEALREEARTEWGQRVVARLYQTVRLMAKASIIGRNKQVIKEAGFRAAGHGALHVLEEDPKAAAAAERIVLREVVRYPLTSRIRVVDRVSRLHGAILAYDLCFEAWDGAARDEIASFIREESAALLEAVGGPETFRPRNEAHVMTCSVVGLGRLALMEAPTQRGGEDEVLRACEVAVGRYLGEAVGEHGFGAYGESVRQAAMASGILPFALALESVTGRDLTGHAAIEGALKPSVLATVPGVGLPVLGEPTAAVDRSGLFAQAFDLAPPGDRPAIVWLFHELGGDEYLGVVRPHHALSVLPSELDEVEPAPPAGGAWPRFFQSPGAHVVGLRSRWKNRDDLLALVGRGHLRLLGLGSRWISSPARDADRYSDSPTAGAIDNLFLFPTGWIKEKGVYEVDHETELLSTSGSGDGLTAVARFGVRGEVRRLRETVRGETKGDEGRREIAVPEGGLFEGERLVAIDCTGLAGVPVVIVVDDRITGGGGAPREWVLHLGFDAKFTMDGGTFTLKHDGRTLRGTLIDAGDESFEGTANAPYANFVHLRTQRERVRVVLTLGPGEPPEIQATEGGIRVEERRIRREKDSFEFAE